MIADTTASASPSNLDRAGAWAYDKIVEHPVATTACLAVGVVTVVGVAGTVLVKGTIATFFG